MYDKGNQANSCPQSIAACLYNLAKKHNVLDTVGSSTSWRWQEGLISRMPKTSTVAAVLTNVYGTSNVDIWYKKAPERLKPFIYATFDLEDKHSLRYGKNIDDIYDTLVTISVSTGNGATRDDLIYKLCSLRYAKSIEEEDCYELPTEEYVTKLYSNWAVIKLDKIIKKNSFSFEDDKYHAGKKHIFISSEKHTRLGLEISILRNKLVGFNSHFDLWSLSWFELTDKQHVEIERKILRFQADLNLYIQNNFDNKKSKCLSLKKRCFSMSAITLPTRNEGFEWVD